MFFLGQRITEILKQGWDEPLSIGLQVSVFWAITHGFIDTVRIHQVKEWETAFLEHLSTQQTKFITALVSSGKLTDELEVQLKTICTRFNQTQTSLMLVAES